MILFGENIDPALVQGLDKRLSRRKRICVSFESAEDRRLRAAKCLPSNAGRPFLQHELSRSLWVHDHESPTDLARFHDHRFSPTRHVEILPLINVADRRMFLKGRSHEQA